MSARDLVTGPVRSAVQRHKSYAAMWRERSAERRSHEPPPTDGNALYFSLEAVGEAMDERRGFSWACTREQRVAAQDYCVRRAFRPISAARGAA